MSSLDFDSETLEMKVKKEINSPDDELGMKFIPDIHPTQTTSIYNFIPDVEIKHEVVDFHHNSTTHADTEVQFDFDQDHGIKSSLSSLSRIPYLDCSSVKAEEKDQKEFYLDLLKCQRDCETCQRYLKMLSEHIRSTHFTSKPIEDPLNIDPLNLDPYPPHVPPPQSSSVQMKCEVEENIDKMDISQEEDSRLNSDPDFESQSESESESDPDYTASPHLTQKVRRRGLTKNKASNDSKNYKAKKEILSSREQFICSTCDMSFSSKGNLVKHRKTHTTEERPQFKCNECDKLFSTKSNLDSHKKLHTGKKTHKCDVCEKCFSTTGHLTRHKRSHTGERPYECTLCEKSFITLSHWQEHQRVHTGERPYDCAKCKKSFRTLSALKCHERAHNGERPHKCIYCEKSFARTDHLTSHRKSKCVGRTVQE